MLSDRYRLVSISIAAAAVLLTAISVTALRPEGRSQSPPGRKGGNVDHTYLQRALATTFRSVHGISIAEAEDRRLVALVGLNRPAVGAEELRLFQVDRHGAGVSVHTPFQHLSSRYSMQAVHAEGLWCVAGVSPTGWFAGACRPVEGPPDAPWDLLPQPPGRRSASYKIVGTADGLYVLVTTTPRLQSVTRCFRLRAGRWEPVGQEVVGRGMAVTASDIDGRPAMTVIKPIAPRIRALRLDERDHWRPLLGDRALRKLSAIGGDGPNLGTPQAIGGDMALGLSKSRGGGFRFGVASLRTGRFSTVPADPRVQSEGAVYRGTKGRVWAVWVAIRADRVTGALRATIRATALTTPSSAWRRNLASAITIQEGRFVPANIVVTHLGDRDYVVYPESSEDRSIYRMSPLDDTKPDA